MIELTRLNGHPLVVNAELIKIVEESPDTVITLVTNDKMVVREAVGEVINRVVAYRRKLLCPANLGSGRGRAAARQNCKE
jgi:flagellar protein FlbD